MRFAGISVLSVGLNCNSKELELILGYWSVGMVWRAEYLIGLLKMIAFLNKTILAEA